VSQMEAKVTGWSERILSGLKEAGGEMFGESMDGKTLRGSKRQGAKNSHLFSAYVHEIGVVLGQVGVDDKTNEIGAIEEFLLGLALSGCVVTADALLTQQKVTQTIVDQGGDYVLPVKENQALTYEAIELWFDAPAVDCLPHHIAEMTEKKHGRLTYWHIETTTALNNYTHNGHKCAFFVYRRARRDFLIFSVRSAISAVS
jgi:predicted transposase YbfD/YdcC